MWSGLNAIRCHGAAICYTQNKCPVISAVAQHLRSRQPQHQIKQVLLIPVAYKKKKEEEEKTSALISGFRTVGMPRTNFLRHPRSFQKSVPGLIPLCKVTQSSRTAKP